MKQPSRYISNLAQSIPPGSPFTGPEFIARERGRPFKARLGANENGFGPAPSVLDAMREAATGNWMYADSTSADLKDAISKHHGVARENVIIGEGIDGLLGVALSAVLNPGETVVTSNGAYPTFNHHVRWHGGCIEKVPYAHDREDLANLAHRAAKTNAKIVYVSNPDNPMGSVWHARDLNDFENNLNPGTVFFLDEAYAETADPLVIPKLDPQNPRVIRFRTFSKAYGMAGARIGYAIANETIIGAMDKLRNQYGINRLGQIAALSAMRDQPYLEAVVGKIRDARTRISNIATANGLEPLASDANFVAIDCGRDGEFAKCVLDEIFRRDVFIRIPSVSPLNRTIRVSTGPKADLDLFEAVLPEALAAARNRI